MIAIRVWSRNLNLKYGFRFGKKIKESNNRIMKNRFEKNQNHNNFNMKRKTNRIWKSFKKIDLNESTSRFHCISESKVYILFGYFCDARKKELSCDWLDKFYMNFNSFFCILNSFFFIIHWICDNFTHFNEWIALKATGVISGSIQSIQILIAVLAYTHTHMHTTYGTHSE